MGTPEALGRIGLRVGPALLVAVLMVIVLSSAATGFAWLMSQNPYGLLERNPNATANSRYAFSSETGSGRGMPTTGSLTNWTSSRGEI